MVKSAQRYTALAVAVVTAAAACSGFDRGWASGHDDNFHMGGSPFAPGVDLHMSLGWWNATTSVSVKTGFMPAEMTFQGGAAKSLGTFSCILLGLSALFALNLLLSSLMDELYPAAMQLDNETEGLVSVVIAGLILVVSTALYIALAYGADHELKKNFSTGMICFPDWACFLSLVAAACWALLAHAARVDGQRSSGPSGYFPI